MDVDALINAPILFDLSNIALAILCLVVIAFKLQLSGPVCAVLLAHLLLIFMLNNVLFPVTYMPDQLSYLWNTQLVRAGQDTSGISQSVMASAMMFSFFPIVVNSVYSLACINYLLYLLLFSFLYVKGVFSRFSMWFFLAYPSFALYTGLALRDTLILFLMIVGMYYALSRRKVLLGLIILLPLYYLKVQNLAIIMGALVAGGLLNARRNRAGVNIALIAFAVIGCVVLSRLISLQTLNDLRLAFFYENNTDRSSLSDITSLSDLLVSAVRGAVTFLMAPLPWEANGGLPALQSLENLLIIILIFREFHSLRARGVRFCSFESATLFCMLLGACLLYGLVLFNAGTAARYRYPFIAAFFVFSEYLLIRKRSESPRRLRSTALA
jgi:hypothetical protein